MTDRGLVAQFRARYPQLESSLPAIIDALAICSTCWKSGGTVFTFGNGGSAADAEHIAAELVKGFRRKRPLPPSTRMRLLAQKAPWADELADRLECGLRVVALPGSIAFVSAFANDVDPRLCVAQLLQVLARPGDVALGISTSGNSPNILAALVVGRALGLRTVGLTGCSGGAMTFWCDVVISVPSEDTADVQELHRPLYHLLCALAEERFFGPREAE